MLSVLKSTTKDDKYVLKEKFYKLMYEFGIYNKEIKTYKLEIIEETSEGFKGKLHLEAGLSFDSLNKYISHIEMYTNYMWVIKSRQFSDYADVEIIKK
jgi:hypothetical protein